MRTSTGLHGVEIVNQRLHCLIDVVAGAGFGTVCCLLNALLRNAEALLEWPVGVANPRLIFH